MMVCSKLLFAVGSVAVLGSLEVSEAGPVDGMKCENGTVLKGETGPERFLEPEFFCNMFPKHPWQYPPLGYGAKPEDKGVQYPFNCDRQLGGYMYANAGKAPCPPMTPEQLTARCLTSGITKEIIRDLACVVMRDPKKLGKFMNNKNRNRNLIEFAAVMAHMGQETADMRTMWEGDGNASQYCDYVEPSERHYCETSKFFGRGVHQLTHPANYADFSEYWFKDRTVLLKNPDRILENMEIAWGSALWFWMEPRQHHNGDASCTAWSLMHDALFQGLGFGETISTINGGIECSGSNSVGPWQRVSRLIFFLDVMKIPMPWVTQGLVTLPSFFTEGCSFINQMSVTVRNTSWANLEQNTQDCSGWNQPYPCGWGGITTGPVDVPRPLVTVMKDGGKFVGAPACPIPYDKKPDQNSWPYNIAPDEGYYQIGGEEATPPTTPTVPPTTPTVPPTTPTVPPTEEEVVPPTEGVTPVPPSGSSCSGLPQCYARCSSHIDSKFSFVSA